jgi:hypothetical protein
MVLQVYSTTFLNFLGRFFTPISCLISSPNQIEQSMSMAVNFEDCVCGNIDIQAAWNNFLKTSTSECQTPSELYRFEDAEVQTGIHTEIIEDVVSKKSRAMTLLDFLSEYHNRRSRTNWEKEIRNGKVSVDGEKVLNPSLTVDPEQYVEYVNIQNDVEVINMLAFV